MCVIEESRSRWRLLGKVAMFLVLRSSGLCPAGMVCLGDRGTMESFFDGNGRPFWFTEEGASMCVVCKDGRGRKRKSNE